VQSVRVQRFGNVVPDKPDAVADFAVLAAETLKSGAASWTNADEGQSSSLGLPGQPGGWELLVMRTPATNGGARIDSYQVKRGALTDEVGSPAHAYTLTELRDGRRYVLLVRAHNIKGFSPWAQAAGRPGPHSPTRGGLTLNERGEGRHSAVRACVSE
jgi:hypothetical protein